MRTRRAFGRALAASLLIALTLCALAPIAYGIAEALSADPRSSSSSPPLGPREFARLGRSALIACGIAAGTPVMLRRPVQRRPSKTGYALR